MFYNNSILKINIIKHSSGVNFNSIKHLSLNYQNGSTDDRYNIDFLPLNIDFNSNTFSYQIPFYLLSC